MIQVPCEFPHVPAGLDMEATEHACPGTGQVNHWDRDAAVNSASNVPGEGELMDGHPEPDGTTSSPTWSACAPGPGSGPQGPAAERRFP